MKTIYFNLIFATLLFTTGCDSTTQHTAGQAERQEIVLDTTFATHLDSLEYIVSNEKLSAFDRLCIYNELSYEFFSIDYDKSIYYARLGLELSLLEKNDTIIGYFYCKLGQAYTYKQEYDSAKINFDKSLFYAIEAKDVESESFLYNAFSILYSYQGNYTTSLEYYDKALRLAEKIENYERIATITYNIGVAYYKNDDYEQAEKYINKAIEIRKTKAEHFSDDDSGSLYETLSLIYMETGRCDEALETSQKYLDYVRSLNSKTREVRALNTSARIYGKCFRDYKKGVELINMALKIVDEIGSDRLKSDCLHTLGELYYNTGDYLKGKMCMQEAIDLVKDEYRKKNIIIGLLKVSIQMKETDGAIDIFNEYDSISTALNNQKVQATISDIETRYETEKKEIEIERQQQVIGRQNIQRSLLAVTGVVLLLGLSVALLLMRSIAQKRRIAEKQKQLAEQEIVRLEQEKRLIATQAVLDGETTERARLARDLHDGLGGKLTVMKLNLEELKQGAQLDTIALAQFDRAMVTLNDSVTEMRRVSHNLMPDTLSRKGLKPAVDDLCRSMSPMIVFNYYGTESRLDPKLEVLIYRCIHELVNNALKYADATQIMVQIIQEDDSISFTVQDNGRGFDPATVTDGTGLQNIRTRVVSFGGDIQIDSKAGEGTEVDVSLRR